MKGEAKRIHDISGTRKASTEFRACSYISSIGRGNYNEYKNIEMVMVTGKKCLNKLGNRDTYTV